MVLQFSFWTFGVNFFNNSLRGVLLLVLLSHLQILLNFICAKNSYKYLVPLQEMTYLAIKMSIVRKINFVLKKFGVFNLLFYKTHKTKSEIYRTEGMIIYCGLNCLRSNKLIMPFSYVILLLRIFINFYVFPYFVVLV